MNYGKGSVGLTSPLFIRDLLGFVATATQVGCRGIFTDPAVAGQCDQEDCIIELLLQGFILSDHHDLRLTI